MGGLLDWGCGHGEDAKWLKQQGYNCSQYDPYYFPCLDSLEYQSFSVVLCTYVLNTIPDYFARGEIIKDAIQYLTYGGTIYVSIRADLAELRGWTKKGTWQGYVGDDLYRGGFDLLRNTSTYQIWRWQNA